MASEVLLLYCALEAGTGSLTGALEPAVVVAGIDTSGAPDVLCGAASSSSGNSRVALLLYGLEWRGSPNAQGEPSRGPKDACLQADEGGVAR